MAGELYGLTTLLAVLRQQPPQIKPYRQRKKKLTQAKADWTQKLKRETTVMQITWLWLKRN